MARGENGDSIYWMAGGRGQWPAIQTRLNLGGYCGEFLIVKLLSPYDPLQVEFRRLHCCFPEASEMGSAFWDAAPGDPMLEEVRTDSGGCLGV